MTGYNTQTIECLWVDFEIEDIEENAWHDTGNVTWTFSRDLVPINK